MLRRSFAMLLLASVVAPASAADEKIRVACVGDSITFGAGVEEREKNNYPKVHGGLLGDKYEVKNFGVSGAMAHIAKVENIGTKKRSTAMC